MKCPYRKETANVDGRIVENFGECYENECPFYGKRVLEKRYEGGFTEKIRPACNRAIKESEDTE